MIFIYNRHFLPFERADLTWLGWVGIGFVVARVRLGRLAVVHYRPDLTNQTSWATSFTLLLGWGGLARELSRLNKKFHKRGIETFPNPRCYKHFLTLLSAIQHGFGIFSPPFGNDADFVDIGTCSCYDFTSFPLSGLFTSRGGFSG